MWECRSCREKIEDRFKHCWNCGNPKAGASETPSPVRIHLQAPPKETAPEAAPPPSEPKIPPQDKQPPAEEIPPKKSAPDREELLFGNTIPYEEKSPSKIKSLVSLVFWLAAALGVGLFAYYSHEKTRAFENRLREEAAAVGSEARQFVFSKDAPREKKGTIRPKVLPLGTTNKELDNLYYSLPDDLRPASLDEVKTILWLDCKPSEAGLYEDGTPAFRDKCNAYLVDRSTSKIVQVQDFSGEPPPLKKDWGTSYASGKVLPETYIAFIRENQPPAERAPFARASDSPDHHIWFKSEMLYAIILLVLLSAAAIGWVIYRIKSAL